MNPHDYLWYDPVFGIFSWKKNKKFAGTINKDGYRIIMIQGVNYQASNLAWFMMKGVWPTTDIDHKNRKRHDDAFENLREATRSQNNANSTTRIDNKLGMKGVCLHKASGRYRATIKINGRQRSLGYFDNPTDAQAAYQAAHKQAYGEFSPY